MARSWAAQSGESVTELYLAGPEAKAFFHLLREQKEEIEGELKYPLEWEELPAGSDSRVSTYLYDVDPGDETDWPSHHQWFASKLNDLHRVFSHRIRELNPDDWSPESSSSQG